MGEVAKDASAHGSAKVRVVEGDGAPLTSIPTAQKIEWLRADGAVVFRGFQSASEDFIGFARELSSEFLDMSLDSRVREMVSDDGVVAGVLKGTQGLPLHMERGYSPVRPEIVFFHMIQPATTGGESLLCNGRRVIEHMPDELVEEFRRRRLKYTHNFEPEAWQKRYGSTPEAVLERFAGRDDVRNVAFNDDVLHYEFITSAFKESRLARDPKPGFLNSLEGGWFVQNAPAAERRAVHEHLIGFEDGPLTQEIVDQVHEAVERATDEMPLLAGDAVVVDNYRWMHGRRAFTGPRVMHTAMAMASF